jgi:PAS domain S-box-containing protein
MRLVGLDTTARLYRLYNRLIRSAAAQGHAEDNPRIHALLGTTLALLGVYAALMLIFILHQDSRAAWMGVNLAFMLGLYALGRSARFTLAIHVLPLAVLIMVVGLVALHPELEAKPAMLMPMLVAGLLWPPRRVAYLAAVSIATALILLLLNAFPWSDLMLPTFFMLAAAAVYLTVIHLLAVTIATLQQRSAELAASEARFRAIFENSLDGFCFLRPVYDAQHNLTDLEIDAVNAVVEAQSGIPRQNLIGSRLRQQYGPSGAALFDCLREVINSQRPTLHKALPHLNQWYSMLFVPVEDGAVFISRDVTAQQQAEAALRESENRFRTIADSAPVFIWTAETDGAIPYFNQTWLQFTGHTLEQEAGSGWLESIHPDDRESCHAQYQQAFDARQPYQMTYRLRRHDGQYRWLLEHGAPRFDAAGTFLGFIGSAVDIDDQRRVEEALRESQAWLQAIIQGMPFYFWAMDANRQYVLGSDLAFNVWGDNRGKTLDEVDIPTHIREFWRDINERAFAGEVCVDEVSYEYQGRMLTFLNVAVPVYDGDRIIGIAGADVDITETKQIEARLRALFQAMPDYLVRVRRDGTYLEVVRGADFMPSPLRKIRSCQRVQDLLPPELAETRMAMIEQALATGQMQTQEYTLYDDAGQPRHLEARVVVCGSDEVLVMVRDITDRKAVEAQQLELTLERERRELLRRFIGDQAHDLMNPLTIVRTSLYLLRRTDDPQRRSEHLDKLEMQADVLEHMIRNMLLMLRLEQPVEDEFDFEIRDVNALVARVVADYQPVALNRQQMLDLDCQANLPLVPLDAEKLERALANLVDNALKYTPDAGRIQVSTRLGADQVCIEVRDSGVGIAEADLPRLFERHFRSARNPLSIHGSGLGLPIVARIVAAHGGTIEVDSRENVGSTFRIRLPLTRSESGGDAVEQAGAAGDNTHH